MTSVLNHRIEDINSRYKRISNVFDGHMRRVSMGDPAASDRGTLDRSLGTLERSMATLDRSLGTLERSSSATPAGDRNSIMASSQAEAQQQFLQESVAAPWERAIGPNAVPYYVK